MTDILRSEDVGYFVFGPDRRYLVFDSVCERLTGRSRDLVLGKMCGCFDLFGCQEAIVGSSLEKLCPIREIQGLQSSEGLVQHRFTVLVNGSKRLLEALYRRVGAEHEEGGYIVGNLINLGEKLARSALEENPASRDAMPGRTGAGGFRDVGAAERCSLGEEYGFDFIVTRSPLMRAVFDQVKAAARARCNVFIFGESGTGKELIARAIHTSPTPPPSGPRPRSPSPRRASGPFICVNCAALPEGVIESELFGHRRGAFTGAEQDNEGLFRAADGGTIFLDELGEMPRATQAKLLRVLQERRVRPVGGTQDVEVDVRIIAATNMPLSQCLESGALRPDLYYRLGVIVIELPPLRERSEDIPFLVHHFLQQNARRFKRAIRAVSTQAMDTLCGYSWPGNIRELENAMESACALTEAERIEHDHLPEMIRRATMKAVPKRDRHPLPDTRHPSPLYESVENLERELIGHALHAAEGNKSRAAELLGIPRRQLYRKLVNYHIV